MKIILTLMCCIALSSCNFLAKKAGGTINIELPNGTKFVSASWSGSSVWYITKPMTPNDVPEIYTMQECSNKRFVEGKIIFKERR